VAAVTVVAQQDKPGTASKSHPMLLLEVVVVLVVTLKGVCLLLRWAQQKP
jgi:hypothetical protein